MAKNTGEAPKPVLMLAFAVSTAVVSALSGATVDRATADPNDLNGSAAAASFTLAVAAPLPDTLPTDSTAAASMSWPDESGIRASAPNSPLVPVALVLAEAWPSTEPRPAFAVDKAL